MDQEIMVFNPKSLEEIEPKKLKHALLKVSFETLCSQYGLNSALIGPAKENLDIVVSENRDFPCFLVKYGGDRDRPLFVYDRQLESQKGMRIWDGITGGSNSKEVNTHLSKTNFLVKIELGQKQLSDMGLLLAYEISRWAAVKGRGIVLGLDGSWYRLNQHGAFLPLE